MKVLVTGAAGDVGRFLVRYLAEKGYAVRALDVKKGDFPEEMVKPEDNFVGSVADTAIVERATDGVESIIHLAWSFSEKPDEIFNVDISGHIRLLEACCKKGIKRFVYTSTATVYGRAVQVPVTEEHPRLVFEARKPLYALAKSVAEDLCAYYQSQKGVDTVIFRFWWAFGESIGGKHLRSMVRDALQGRTLEVPSASGGTFVTMADLAKAVDLALTSDKASGKVYNVGSFYITWDEIAQMIIDVTGSKGGFSSIPLDKWSGPQFLSDDWRMSWDRAEQELGYRPTASRAENLMSLKKAIAAMADALRVEAV